MFKRLCLALTVVMTLVTIKPAMAFDNYLDGITTLEEVMDYTLTNHVSDPSLDDLVNSAIDGMLETLDDPYTEYMTPETLEEFTDSLNGDYIGIGVEIESENGYAKIVKVFANSPAQRAGIKVGDIIVGVDGEDVYKKPLSSVVDKILGDENTPVNVTIRRENDIEITLQREAVKAATVNVSVDRDNITYIRVNSFGDNTGFEFSSEIKKALSEDTKGIIIDLRDNPGGYVMTAVRMASNFLPPGSEVTSMIERSGEATTYPTFGDNQLVDVPVVIMVNENSASASEILAGALQHYKKAQLLGVQTYGKGTVQTVISLSNGGALKLTVAKYQLPNGKFIDGLGLTPDVIVKTPELQLLMAKQLIQPTNEKTTIKLNLDQNNCTINNQELKINSVPYVKNSVYYLPLCFVMEAFGYEVEWNQERNGIEMKRSDKELFVSTNGDTIHLVEVTEGVSYISTDDLSKLGLQSKIEGRSIIITED